MMNIKIFYIYRDIDEREEEISKWMNENINQWDKQVKSVIQSSIRTRFDTAILTIIWEKEIE